VGLTTLPPSVSRLSNSVGSLTSHNPIGLQGLLQKQLHFTLLTNKWTQAAASGTLTSWDFRAQSIVYKIDSNLYRNQWGSLGSSVGTATGYISRTAGVHSWQGQEIFLHSTSSRQVPGPTQLLYDRHLGLLPGYKSAGALSWQLTSIKCRVRNGAAISLLPIHFHGVVLNCLIN
jgi:hypothetical protein